MSYLRYLCLFVGGLMSYLMMFVRLYLQFVCRRTHVLFTLSVFVCRRTHVLFTLSVFVCRRVHVLFTLSVFVCRRTHVLFTFVCVCL